MAITCTTAFLPVELINKILYCSWAQAKNVREMKECFLQASGAEGMSGPDSDQISRGMLEVNTEPSRAYKQTNAHNLGQKASSTRRVIAILLAAPALAFVTAILVRHIAINFKAAVYLLCVCIATFGSSADRLHARPAADYTGCQHGMLCCLQACSAKKLKKTLEDPAQPR